MKLPVSPGAAAEMLLPGTDAAARRRDRGAREAVMIPCGDIHHLRLTVTDVQRSREFYTGLLGFQFVVESPPPGDPGADEVFKLLFGGVVMARGNLIMGLRPMAPAADRFHPDRAGLDHLSFGVPGRADLEQASRLFDEHGVTHVQHQLLLASKGHHGNLRPTIGDLAGYLLLRPHSAVELVDRAEGAGLVERTPDGDDGRVVRVRLTSEGDRILRKLTRAHLERLHELATVLDELVTRHGSLTRASTSGPARQVQRAAVARGRSAPSTRLGVSRSCSQRGFASPALKLLKAPSMEFRRGSDRPTALPIRLSARLSLGDRHMANLPRAGLALNQYRITIHLAGPRGGDHRGARP